MIAVEAILSQDDMVHQEKSHHLARLGYLLREHIVRLARLRAVRWVVVCHGDDGCIVEHGFFHYQSNVHRCLGDASLAELGALYQPKVLVHQHYPKALCLIAAYHWAKIVVECQAAA